MKRAGRCFRHLWIAVDNSASLAASWCGSAPLARLSRNPSTTRPPGETETGAKRFPVGFRLSGASPGAHPQIIDNRAGRSGTIYHTDTKKELADSSQRNRSLGYKRPCPARGLESCGAAGDNWQYSLSSPVIETSSRVLSKKGILPELWRNAWVGRASQQQHPNRHC